MSGLSIGVFTPFVWGSASSVNRQIQALVGRLTARGHRVTLIAPSADHLLVAETGRLVSGFLAGERPTLFSPHTPYPRLFLIDAAYAVRDARRQSLPFTGSPGFVPEVAALLSGEDFDLLHLHEPFVSGVGPATMRHATCPLLASLYADPERLDSFGGARQRMQELFDSLDEAIAVSYTARDAAALSLSGEYRVVPLGVDLDEFYPDDDEAPGPLRLVFSGREPRRQGLGVLMRALRYLTDLAPALTLDVYGSGAFKRHYLRLVPPAFARRITFHLGEPKGARPEAFRRATIVCVPSLVPDTAEVTVLEAMASGAAVVASAVPQHREIVQHGHNGLLVRSRDSLQLAAALRELIENAPLRRRLVAQALRDVRRHDWDCVLDELCSLYEAAERRRKPLSLRPPRSRQLLADLHIHSHHSKDSVTPVEEILERAREVGLDVVAITDHDTVAGGLEAREIADRYGLRVIVGEEVMTREGEVIGLFLERTVPPGMSFAETLAAIKEQGGVVTIPHPFDHLHKVPSAQLLRDNVAQIDALEVFNSRLLRARCNDLAEQFARRYRLPPVAGSDAHVLPSIGTAFCSIGEFSGAQDFVAALAQSAIVRRPRSRMYLQSLKFIQTKLVPARGGGREHRQV